MDALPREIREARELVTAVRERDLRRGVKLAYILLAALVLAGVARRCWSTWRTASAGRFTS